MNNKALRLFGEAFLRTLVIVFGLLIIGFAIFFLVKVVTTGNNTNNQSKVESTMDEDALQQQLDDENATADDATNADATTDSAAADATSEAPADSTEEQTPEVPAVSSKDLKIAVLNSTGTKGLAGAWVDKLKAEGYTQVYAGNYKIGQLAASKVIAVAEGTGSDLVSLFKGAALENGSLTSGYNLVDATVSTTDIDIFIIIGTDDNIVQ